MENSRTGNNEASEVGRVWQKGWGGALTPSTHPPKCAHLPKGAMDSATTEFCRIGIWTLSSQRISFFIKEPENQNMLNL